MIDAGIYYQTYVDALGEPKWYAVGVTPYVAFQKTLSRIMIDAHCAAFNECIRRCHLLNTKWLDTVTISHNRMTRPSWQNPDRRKE